MCASCGTPICPKCMVSTPVGMKCRDCGTNRNSTLFKVRPERFVLAGITSLVAGVIAGFLGAFGSFLMFFFATAYGYFVGSMILRASGMKRGLKLEILAGTMMVTGGLGVKLAQMSALFDPYFWIVLAIATGCAVSKIRYL